MWLLVKRFGLWGVWGIENASRERKRDKGKGEGMVGHLLVCIEIQDSRCTTG